MKWQYRRVRTWELGVEGKYGSVVARGWPKTIFWAYVGAKKIGGATTIEKAMALVEEELPDLLRLAITSREET